MAQRRTGWPKNWQFQNKQVELAIKIAISSAA
ncbi:hypothetical protein R69888_05583 [Paraburkholderia haematera]|uniref:Transposase n=1 Tax=Paraburkholderia haematera TaxID=2793077 RepID=A0ABM8SGY7_9BURK|nr:hypothetical protein R69888_05583 [Paraburkholderia haematera]